MPELPGEDNTSPGHPVRRLEVEQADSVRDLLNKTDLGENARGHYAPAASDNVKGVGRVLDKEVVEPLINIKDYGMDKFKYYLVKPTD